MEAAGNARRPYLRAQVLSLWEVLAQSVAAISPTATPAIAVALVFGIAGNATWLAYAFATCAVLLVAWHINQFARAQSSPGALYTFVGRGMGPFWGAFTGWSGLTMYLLALPANLAIIAIFIKAFLHNALGWNLNSTGIVVLAVLTTGLLWLITYKDIRFSTRLMLLLELVSIGVVLLLILFFFLGPGELIDSSQLFLENITLPGFGLGLTLAFLSFGGFESAATLGHEAKLPHKTVPRVILYSVLLTGPFFVFTSYAMVAAFRDHTPSLDKMEAPLNNLAALAGAPILGHFITLGAAISLFAASLAFLNAGSRLIFAMARHGLALRAAGNAHAVNATPHVALAGICVLGLGLFLGLFLAGVKLLTIVTWFGTIGMLGLIFSYLLVCIASPIYFRKQKRPVGKAVIMSVLAIAFLLAPLIGSLYPVPPPPLCYLPYVFVAWLAGGMLWFWYLRLRRPHVMGEMYRDFEAQARG